MAILFRTAVLGANALAVGLSLAKALVEAAEQVPVGIEQPISIVEARMRRLYREKGWPVAPLGWLPVTGGREA